MISLECNWQNSDLGKFIRANNSVSSTNCKSKINKQTKTNTGREGGKTREEGKEREEKRLQRYVIYLIFYRYTLNSLWVKWYLRFAFKIVHKVKW